MEITPLGRRVVNHGVGFLSAAGAAGCVRLRSASLAKAHRFILR